MTPKPFLQARAAELLGLAKAAAVRHKLPVALVLAVCEQESGWNPSAGPRHEPAFFTRYGAWYIKRFQRNEFLRDTANYASFGLMQVMYPVAVEQGYTGAPADLAVPETNVEFGCKLLAEKMRTAKWLPEMTEPPAAIVHQALLFWNGGGRPAYADEVMARIPKYVDSTEAA